MLSQKIKIHKDEDFHYMRKAGALAAKTLKFIEPYVKPGISTLALNDLCHDFIISNNAIPAPLNYKGFPKSICTSVNNVVCHGIPSEEKILEDGDIINVDVTVILDGWHGDTSKTFMVGDSFLQGKSKTIKARKLVEITFEAMMLGIESAKPGNKLSDIGRSIQNHVEKYNFSIVRDYCGHGIGEKFHTEPVVLHYVPTNEKFIDTTLEPGMFFTIEPMVNAGKYNVILSRKDNWTVTTADGSLSAQFEHTIGITDAGNEIFTL